MHYPNKKQRLTGDANLAEATADGDHVGDHVGDLSSTDVLANIFGFLGAEDIMQKRRVNKRWGEGVKKTVPSFDFWVHSLTAYNVVGVMTRALPNLQQITIRYLEYGRHKYSDGEDPNEEQAARTADYTTRDIGIISNFSKLRELYIDEAPLNGRYPSLFNFPLLQKLGIIYCHYLKFDLDMLAGLPMLKELRCEFNSRLTGNMSSLRVLKDTLEKIDITRCRNVEGNFMDLADFPHLKRLDLEPTAVTGDIRDIGENDFSALEHLSLPKTVYGGKGYEFQRISDGPDVARAVYLLKKQRPTLTMGFWHVMLSKDSPDRYENRHVYLEPPFCIRLVQAGSRTGYQWGTANGIPCEVNWLDPQPDRESSGYEKYIEEWEEIDRQVKFYKGFYQPPTEEEYNSHLEEVLREESSVDREYDRYFSHF
jgi:hypothetical protein